MTESQIDIAPGAHTDFSRAMSYGDYLHLDGLLTLQHPLSDQHDEMLFIIIHQTSELWMKLMLHELNAAKALMRVEDISAVLKAMARVKRIQAQLIQSWDVLATMTPADYLKFRDSLGQSSGFQSAQYRLIEFMFGNKQEQMIKPHRHRPDLAGLLDKALAAPSLYDEAMALLARRGFAIAPEVLGRDLTKPHVSDPSVLAAWLTVYRDTAQYWDLYELAEELVDLEDMFQQWRFRHVTTVQRIIGFRRGTGGSAGVGYLRKVLDTVFFPELWDVRTSL
jgi:tryptophan 2,3-dioxygenase